MWGERERIEGETTTQVLEGDKRAWKLITVHENRHSGLAPAFCHRLLQSPFYHIAIMIIIIVNALVTASITFRHTSDEKPREFFFQDQKKLELWFTVFYDVEVVFKIFCLSFRGYISRWENSSIFCQFISTFVLIVI